MTTPTGAPAPDDVVDQMSGGLGRVPHEGQMPRRMVKSLQTLTTSIGADFKAI